MWRPNRFAALHAQPRTRGPGVRAGSAVAGLEQLAPLVLVQAAPDAVRLAEVDRVIEALALHRALATDRLRPRFADVAVFAPLGVRRRKEQGRLRTAACRTRPPRVECVDGHGPPSPSERLAARNLLGWVAP